MSDWTTVGYIDNTPNPKKDFTNIGERIDNGLTIYRCCVCVGLCEIIVNGKDIMEPLECPYRRFKPIWEKIR